MNIKDLQIEVLTTALKLSDGLCEWCVGCRARGKPQPPFDALSETDCLTGDDRGYNFVLATETLAREFGIIDENTVVRDGQKDIFELIGTHNETVAQFDRLLKEANEQVGGKVQADKMFRLMQCMPPFPKHAAKLVNVASNLGVDTKYCAQKGTITVRENSSKGGD